MPNKARKLFREEALERFEQQQKDLSESLRRESVTPMLHSETLKALEQKRQSVEQSLSREKVEPVLYKQTLAALAEKRKSLLERSSKIRSLLQTLQQRVENRRHLFQQKVISQDVLLQAQQDLLNQETQLGDIQTQLKDLDVQKTSSEREYLVSYPGFKRVTSVPPRCCKSKQPNVVLLL